MHPTLYNARALALAVLALATLAPRPARAQRSVVRGRVVAPDTSGRAAAGAEVSIAALGRTTRVGDDGSFVLDALPAGTHELLARRLGHEPASRRITVDGRADTVTVLLALAPRVQALSQVEVRAEAAGPAAPARRAFERERARANGGAFVSDSLLAASEHSPMSNVLRRIPGATIVRYPSTRGAYNVLGSRRGGQSLRSGEKYCLYQIYVDGQLRYAPAALNVEPPPDVDEFKVGDFEAIEVYRGPSQTPVQLGGTGAPCGTVAFWSRSRR